MAIVSDVVNKVPPHGVVHGWLGTETVGRLLRLAQSNEHRFEDTWVKHRDGRQEVDRTRRVSRRLRGIDDELKTELRSKLEQLLPAIFDKLGSKPFTPDQIEVELVAHGNGAFFARHIDTMTGIDRERRGRAISAIYYFHSLPKSYSGGVLRLHSVAATGQEGTFVDIVPGYDTLVFFPSFFPHEVQPVQCTSEKFLDSRFAINFWIYRK